MSMGQNPSITVSASAAAQIGKIIAGEGASKMLRVSVSGGGCSGFQYGFDLVDSQDDDDLAIERDGVTVVIDPISADYMSGSEIDYVNDLIGASFQIKNPLAQSECGCGNSFSL
jgi:iron-sulfur cluster insertion protein